MDQPPRGLLTRFPQGRLTSHRCDIVAAWLHFPDVFGGPVVREDPGHQEIDGEVERVEGDSR